MSDNPQTRMTDDSEMINRISEGSKQFYSAGASFTPLTCAVVVLIVWSTVAKMWPILKCDACGLVLSLLLVFAYAFVIPEPKGYPHEGKLRITPSEAVFGVFNPFLVFSTAVGIRAL